MHEGKSYLWPQIRENSLLTFDFEPAINLVQLALFDELLDLEAVRPGVLNIAVADDQRELPIRIVLALIAAIRKLQQDSNRYNIQNV